MNFVNHLLLRPGNFFRKVARRQALTPQQKAHKNFLSNIPLFKNFTEKQLQDFIPFIQEVNVNPGDILTKEGEFSKELFIVQQGVAEVVKGLTLENPGYRLGLIQAGACFGEMALLEENTPRSATVRVVHPSRLFIINERNLNQLALKNQSAYAALMNNIARDLSKRVRETSEMTVASLKKELELTQRAAGMGRFFCYLILMWTFYTLFLGLVGNLKNNLYITAFADFGLIACFSLTCFIMMKHMGYPLAIYGLTSNNWRKSLREGLLSAIGIIVFYTMAKWLLLISVPIFSGLPLFNKPGMFNPHYAHYINLLILFAVIFGYTLFAPLQEFIFRSAAQGSMQMFLTGKYKTTMAIFISSSLFAVAHVHLSMWLVFLVFPPGVIWGILYARCNNLIGVCVSHVLVGLWAFFALDLEGMIKVLE